MKISGKIFLVYYSGEQFVSDLLTGLFFPYRNFCALLPVLLRLFLGETIKNPDNHLDISSFFLFLPKKKCPLSLGCILYSAFCFLICPLFFIPLPHKSLWAFLPPSLPHCECHYPRDIRKISRCKQKHKSLCFSAPTFFFSIFPFLLPPAS